MGMGDKQQKYTPSHHTSFCAVLRNYFPDISMRQCPHEAVQMKYGAGCKVSVYVCAKCRYGVKHPLFNGWSCTLKV